MIRIAIVEDEEEYIQQLTDYLQEYQKNSKEEIAVTVYRDGDEITSKYKSQFDIILMDIQMKFINGMTAAQEIRSVDSSVSVREYGAIQSSMFSSWPSKNSLLSFGK